MKRIHDRHIIKLDIYLVNVLANIFCGSAHTRILAKERSASGPTSYPGSFFKEGKTLVGAGHVTLTKLIA